MLGYACPVGPTRTMLMTSLIETVELEGTRDSARHHAFPILAYN